MFSFISFFFIKINLVVSSIFVAFTRYPFFIARILIYRVNLSGVVKP